MPDLHAFAESIGVPVTQRGQPDLLNAVPIRFVPQSEAKTLGASWFYDGAACRYGHQAARRTSNANICSDCQRVKAGRHPIYPRSRAQEFYAEPRRKAQSAAPAIVQTSAPVAPEPDPTDKKFLDAYARERNLERAAQAVGTTAASISARRAASALLDTVMQKLEQSLSIPRFVPAAPTFEWTDEKRETFIRAYIDSGELATARDAIGCSPSQFFAELDANFKFQAALDEAAPKAARALEDVAIRLAKVGNDRLLQKVLAAKLPREYRETHRVDLNVTDYSKLSDAEINGRFFAALEALGIRVIDDEAIDVTPAPALPPPDSHAEDTDVN